MAIPAIVPNVPQNLYFGLSSLKDHSSAYTSSSDQQKWFFHTLRNATDDKKATLLFLISYDKSKVIHTL